MKKNRLSNYMAVLLIAFAIVGLCQRSTAQIPDGFNNDYTKLIQLRNLEHDNPARDNLVAVLENLGSDHNALRYIGGNEGKGLGYDPGMTEWFIQLCYDGGVTDVVLRVEVNDLWTGMQNYIQIRDAGLNVRYVNFGNEEYGFGNTPYQADNLRELIFWKHFEKVKQRKWANTYADEFLRFAEIMDDAGYPEVKDKMVWCTILPYNAVFRIWHNTLVKRLGDIGYKITDHHFYPDPRDPGKIDQYRRLMGKSEYKDLRVIVSEFQPYGLHLLPNNREKQKYYLNQKQADAHISINEFFDEIGVEWRMAHNLFHFDHYNGYYGVVQINRDSGSVDPVLIPVFKNEIE